MSRSVVATMVVALAVCISMCAAVETVAWMMNLWIYAHAWQRIVHIVLGGMMFGGLALAVAEESLVVQAAAGACVGIIIEGLNLRFLRVWTFPGERLLFLENKMLIAIAAGGGWGCLPIAANYIQWAIKTG